jgi:hypothetical protein
MHVVNRISLDLTLRDERQAAQLVAQWTPHITDALSDVLNEICGAYDNDSTVLTIDRLDLEIGELNGEGLPEKLRQLQNGFREILRQKMTPLLFNVHSTFEHGYRQTDSDALSSPTLPGQSFPEIPVNTSAARTHKSDHVLRTLLHFLETGNLPWWHASANFSVPEILQQLCIDKEEALRAALSDIHQRHNDAIPRLLQHAGPASRQMLFQLFDLSEPVLERLVKKHFDRDFSNKLAENINTDPHTHILKTAILLFREGSADLMESAIDVYFEKQAVDVETYLKTARAITEEPVVPTEIRQISHMTIESFGFSATKADKDNLKYRVEDAGIVLTAGFLSHYFKQLGLLNEDGFVSEEARFAAAHALKYLANGYVAPSEHTLALEKLLCGLDPETFVPLDITLDSEALEAEGTELLTTLISHWSALKNTSIEGLRQTFLHRGGILERLSEFEWALHVERGVFDMLLHLLPAGFPLSTLVFSWSKFILYVNWERP